MSENTIRSYREEFGYTQNDLAEKSGLSLRTIQRVDSGQVIPKGHTLTQLARVFDLNPSEFRESLRPSKGNKEEDKLTLKLINLSALSFFVFPFGNLVVPIWLWRRNRSSGTVDRKARTIINFQIIWSLCLAFFLCIAPFLDDFVGTSIPLIFLVLLAGVLINTSMCVKIAKAIQKDQQPLLDLPFRLL